MGRVGRTHRTVLPRRQDRATTVVPANHAARSFHTAMVHTIRSRYERILLRHTLYRGFAQLEEYGRLPDESTILRFRYRLEKHKRDPDMHSSKKDEQMYFGMKAHIDAESGLVHTVCGTSGSVSDVTGGNRLLHGEEKIACGDAGY